MGGDYKDFQSGKYLRYFSASHTLSYCNLEFFLIWIIESNRVHYMYKLCDLSEHVHTQQMCCRNICGPKLQSPVVLGLNWLTYKMYIMIYLYAAGKSYRA
ncbi:hypothetical protein GDO81_008565 [Engystomops pustulosus]|uniref:Uncharacterized protein n=1 Tax=Engystomops pustulosus TaxID=76066 RepID=A0AAV7CG91_ENGPU|nr:hypothetical protein GDO81_008565 [Engystomops pustulosus]